MAIPVLIMGPSGAGKTFSLKNFSASEVGVISVEKGRLPFKSDIKVAKIPKNFEDAKDYATLNRAKYAKYSGKNTAWQRASENVYRRK